jgi:hypothetical protein
MILFVVKFNHIVSTSFFKGIKMRYIFASLRTPEFTIDGISPEDAWKRLCEREKNNGNLWKTSDVYRNRYAVENQGFSWLTKVDGVAYKEV